MAKMTMEQLCECSKDELLSRLKGVYNKQKLGKFGNILARSIELVFFLIAIFVVEWNWISGILGALYLLYTVKRLFWPHSDDKDNYEKFELIVNNFENYKRYRKGEIDANLSEKEQKKTEKNLVYCFNALLNPCGWAKIVAFIPVINFRADEMWAYTDINGPLTRIIDGAIGGAVGLKYFSDENLSGENKESIEENN